MFLEKMNDFNKVTDLKCSIFSPQGEPGEAGPPGVGGEPGKKVRTCIQLDL